MSGRLGFTAAELRFRSVEVRLIAVRDRSVLFEAAGARRYVPRTCLDAPTRRAVDKAEPGATLTAGIHAWKADQLGWTGRPADHPKLL